MLINAVEAGREGGGAEENNNCLCHTKLGEELKIIFQLMSPPSGQTENTLITNGDQMNINIQDFNPSHTGKIAEVRDLSKAQHSANHFKSFRIHGSSSKINSNIFK